MGLSLVLPADSVRRLPAVVSDSTKMRALPLVARRTGARRRTLNGRWSSRTAAAAPTSRPSARPSTSRSRASASPASRRSSASASTAPSSSSTASSTASSTSGRSRRARTCRASRRSSTTSIGEVVLGEATFKAEKLAQHIAEHVRERQDARRAEVTIAARYPEHKPAPVSGIPTQEIYTLFGSAVASERGTRRLVGVAAQGMTACPCAQQLVAGALARAARRRRLHRRRDRAHLRARARSPRTTSAASARCTSAARRRATTRSRRAAARRSSRARCPARSTS